MKTVIHAYNRHSHKYPGSGKAKLPGSLLLAVLLIGASGSSIGAGPEVFLTLRDVFDRVEVENFQVLVNRESIEDARQVALRDRAALLPKISLEAFRARTQIASVGTGFADFAPRFPPLSRFDAKITGELSLLNANDLATWRLSKYQYEISELTYRERLQDILDQTARAYFTHLRNLRRMEVFDANIERDRVLLDLARTQFQAGVTSPIDVTRAKVRLAADHKERLQQETIIMQSDLELKKILNFDLGITLQLDDREPAETLAARAGEDTLQDILEARPDYLKASYELKRNRFARKAAGWEILPTIQLFGEWGYAAEKAFDGREEEAWLGGVTFTVPIFDGFRIQSNKRRASALVRLQEYALRDIELRVKSEHLLARQDVQSRFAQIDIARRKLALSEEELDLARTRFTKGVADNRDVVDAQANLAGSGDELVESIYQYNLSRLFMASIRGDARLLLDY